jgi:hypothetical protein
MERKRVRDSESERERERERERETHKEERQSELSDGTSGTQKAKTAKQLGWNAKVQREITQHTSRRLFSHNTSYVPTWSDVSQSQLSPLLE